MVNFSGFPSGIGGARIQGKIEGIDQSSRREGFFNIVNGAEFYALYCFADTPGCRTNKNRRGYFLAYHQQFFKKHNSGHIIETGFNNQAVAFKASLFFQQAAAVSVDGGFNICQGEQVDNFFSDHLVAGDYVYRGLCLSGRLSG